MSLDPFAPGPPRSLTASPSNGLTRNVTHQPSSALRSDPLESHLRLSFGENDQLDASDSPDRLVTRSDARRVELLDELANAEQGSWRDLSSRTGHDPSTQHTAAESSSAQRHIRGMHSPPRRLSGIMNSPSNGTFRLPPSSGVSTSSADVFHPSSPPGSSFQDYFSRSPHIHESQRANTLPGPSRSPPSDMQSLPSPVRAPEKPLPSPHDHDHARAKTMPSSSSSHTSSLRPTFSLSRFAKSVSSPSTPTASHFVPPSGAPGYGGENHDWNKSRFEYDVTSEAQAASPSLVGFKPGVRQILDEDLADQVGCRIGSLALRSSHLNVT
jgi:hypothetical protein